MANSNIVFSHNNGSIVHRGCVVISYEIDIPCVIAEGFPNALFITVADNYLTYLKRLSECRLIPLYDKMREDGMRARDVKKETGMPLEASLVWKVSHVEKRYLSMCCETSLTFSEKRKIFTLKTLTVDLENMTVARVSDFSTKRRKKKYSFFLSGKKLYVFDKKRVIADSTHEAKEKMGVRLRKMNNNRLQNL